MTQEEIKTVIDLFLTWNGRDEPIDIANLDFAVDFIEECLKTEAPQKEIKGGLENAAKDYSEGYWNNEICKISSRSFIAGAKWDRNQMMEEAVEGKIIKSYNPVINADGPSLHGIELIYSDEGKPYLLAGDKVRVIVIKEDEK